jgi:hypothetical protein
MALLLNSNLRRTKRKRYLNRRIFIRFRFPSKCWRTHEYVNIVR